MIIIRNTQKVRVVLIYITMSVGHNLFLLCRTIDISGCSIVVHLLEVLLVVQLPQPLYFPLHCFLMSCPKNKFCLSLHFRKILEKILSNTPSNPIKKKILHFMPTNTMVKNKTQKVS